MPTTSLFSFPSRRVLFYVKNQRPGVSTTIFRFGNLSPRGVFDVVLSSLPHIRLFRFLSVFLVPPLPYHRNPRLFTRTRQPHHHGTSHNRPHTTRHCHNGLRKNSTNGPIHWGVPRNRPNPNTSDPHGSQHARPPPRARQGTTTKRRPPHINNTNMRTKRRSRGGGTLRPRTKRRRRCTHGTRAKIPRAMPRGNFLFPCSLRNAIRRTLRMRRQRKQTRSSRMTTHLNTTMRNFNRQLAPRPRHHSYRHQRVTNRPRRPISRDHRPPTLTPRVNLNSLKRRRSKGTPRRSRKGNRRERNRPLRTTMLNRNFNAPTKGLRASYRANQRRRVLHNIRDTNRAASPLRQPRSIPRTLSQLLQTTNEPRTRTTTNLFTMGGYRRPNTSNLTSHHYPRRYHTTPTRIPTRSINPLRHGMSSTSTSNLLDRLTRSI